jgi:hypothetical protein
VLPHARALDAVAQVRQRAMALGEVNNMLEYLLLPCKTNFLDSSTLQPLRHAFRCVFREHRAQDSRRGASVVKRIFKASVKLPASSELLRS